MDHEIKGSRRFYQVLPDGTLDLFWIDGASSEPSTRITPFGADIARLREIGYRCYPTELSNDKPKL